MALRQARTVDPVESMATAPAVEELVQPADDPLSTFGRDSVPDLDVVMTVLYESEGP